MSRREFDCERCGKEICECPRWWRGLLVRVLVVIVGLYVTGCVAGALAKPWCD